LLAGLPVNVNVLAERAAGVNLPLGDGGLLGGEKPGTRLAPHCLRQAVIRAMASFRVMSAGTAGLATSNGTFGNRTTTHGFGLSQFRSDLSNTRWDIG